MPSQSFLKASTSPFLSARDPLRRRGQPLERARHSRCTGRPARRRTQRASAVASAGTATGPLAMTTSAEQMRAFTGPAILSYGFRPFFLVGALWATHRRRLVAAHAERPPRVTERLLRPIEWHVHEPVYGYVPAVIAGFLLTAVPNWTGRLPIVGAPLLPAVPDLGCRPHRHPRVALDWGQHCRGHRPCVSCRARARRRPRGHCRQQHPQSESARRRCAFFS